MRKISLIIISTLLFSCGEKVLVSNRPAEQIKFVNLIQSLRDQVKAAEKDKAQRSMLLERGVPYVKQFIKDSLQLKFNAWEARVLDIKENYPHQGSTELKLGIAYDPSAILEKLRYQSIVLNYQNQADSEVSKLLKEFKTGDYVKINGEFIEKEGFIDIDSYSSYKFSKNIFDNPEFKVKISAAEKL